MKSLQRNVHSSHPASGAVLTAAQKALQLERSSLSSLHAAAAVAAAAAATHTAAAAGVDDDDVDVDVDSAVSLSQFQEPGGTQSTSPPPQQPPVSSAKVRSARNSTTDGMRREWKFALQFVHAAGQLLVPCSPQWEYDFIDIDRTAYGLAQRTHPAAGDTTPMLAVLSYTDRTAVLQAAPPPPSSSTITSSGTAALLPRRSENCSGVDPAAAAATAAATPTYDKLLANGSLGDATVAAAAVGGDWWVEKSKQVELFYCHPAPDTTMEQFCKLCVKFVLRDPHVVSVDGDSHLAHLRVGDKLRCPHQLGGQSRSFHMRYVLRDRSELQETYVYAIGALVGQRGYLLRAQCTSAEELEGYVQSVLLPTYAATGRAQFGVDVTYHNVPPTALLTDQQEAFGELQYVDHKAAIVFVTPMYPMKILPDYSPAKTVGVGSITCMTLELSVHERLLDDAVAAEVIGVAKYKVNPVVLCVEVEEVSRMGYPKVMSTEQYSELKAKRVADVFPDAKMVGLPTSLYVGNRTGRSRTMTFAYEPLRCVVKALVTSTLVGNFGVTAFYITKLSGGLFDSHLYVFQQLLSGMEFLPQNSFAKNARVSRYRAQNIRLGEEDLLRAYRCVNNFTAGNNASGAARDDAGTGGGEGSSDRPASPALPPHPACFTTNDPAVVNAARERHLHMLKLGNDGRVEGGVEALIPVEEGGVPSRRAMQNVRSGPAKQHSPANTGAAATAGATQRTTAADGEAADLARRPSASLFSASRSMTTVASMASEGYIAAAVGVDDDRRGMRERNGSVGGATSEEDGSGYLHHNSNMADFNAVTEAGSMHSSSCISVEGISRLISELSDNRDETMTNEEADEEEEEEDGGDGCVDTEMRPLLTGQPDASAGAAVAAASLSDGGGGGFDGSAAAAAAVPASTSTTLHQHSRQRSPLTSGPGRRGGDGSCGSSAATSRPSSAKQQKYGDEAGSVDSAASSPSPSPSITAAVTGAGEGVAAAVTEGADAAAPTASTAGGVVGPADVNAGGGGATAASHAAASAAGEEEVLRQGELYEQLIGKDDPLVKQTLQEGERGTTYGPALRDVYARCCEAQQCRPNSYLMQKLPVQPELTYSVEELDLSSNYVGHNGFVAVLHLLEHLPRLRVVYFNNMSLDNVDVENLCYVLSTNPTVREVHLENNTGISLPSTRHFTALLRANRQIEVLALDGTRLSPTLIQSLRAEVSRPHD